MMVFRSFITNKVKDKLKIRRRGWETSRTSGHLHGANQSFANART